MSLRLVLLTLVLMAGVVIIAIPLIGAYKHRAAYPRSGSPSSRTRPYTPRRAPRAPLQPWSSDRAPSPLHPDGFPGHRLRNPKRHNGRRPGHLREPPLVHRRGPGSHDPAPEHESAPPN